ncbi:MAG: Zn-ribbon OB-fold protein [Nevskia sp.]|nr:Zn-ribbon OB-fold protein [Nevskia sp.]
MSTPDEAVPVVPAAPKPMRLAPLMTLDAKFFWDAADREEFVGQQCGDCDRHRFPPAPMCPDCNSLNTLVVPLSGRGTVVSWIKPIHPPALGFKEPPTVALIELEEGTRFVSNVVGIPFEQVTLNMAVEVCFEETMGNHKVPVFRPSK